MKITVFGHTDTGKKRPVNEDNYLCLDLGKHFQDNRIPFYLLAVADGIGGHAGGQIASAKAVEILREKFLSYADSQSESIDWDVVLVEAFQQANREIFSLSAQNQNLKGMGTTLVAVVIRGDQCAAANIGDSRLYRVQDLQLEQITQDHSWRAEQLRKNILSEAEIIKSPFKNMITRSLGYDRDVKVDSYKMTLHGNDYLLLCTDGLYGPLNPKLMLKTFRKGKTVQAICYKLVQQANRYGGTDNITGIVAFFEAGESQDRPRPQPSDTVRLDDLGL